MDRRPTTYVFAETKWQNVNFVPALVLGPIDRIIVLVAERGGRFTDLDEQNAIVSARGFADAYKQALAEQGINREPELTIERGHVTGVGTWRRKMKALFEASPPNTRIVFSYLAGPTDTKIGVWRALDDIATTRSDIEVQRVSYDAESRLNWADSETEQNVDARISLASWLALCGRSESREHRLIRQKRENEISKRIRLIETIRGLAFQPFPGISQPDRPVEEAWYTRLATRWEQISIDKIVAMDKALKEAPQQDVQAFCKAFAALTAEAERVFSVAFPPERATSRASPATYRFVKSDWFEELIFVELQRRLPGATVALDVKISPAHSDNPGRNEFAIDLAIMARNQMHIVEAKAHNPDTAAAGERRAWMDQISAYREAVVGPGGLSMLMLAAKFASESELRDWARLRQVRIADGWPAIDTALSRLAEAGR